MAALAESIPAKLGLRKSPECFITDGRGKLVVAETDEPVVIIVGIVEILYSRVVKFHTLTFMNDTGLHLYIGEVVFTSSLAMPMRSILSMADSSC